MFLAVRCECVMGGLDSREASMRALVPLGLLAWMAGLFVAHQRIHATGCLTEARWASQNDEVYDRELEAY